MIDTFELTRRRERELRDTFDTVLRGVEDKDALRQVLDAVAEARATGLPADGHTITVRASNGDYVYRIRLVD